MPLRHLGLKPVAIGLQSRENWDKGFVQTLAAAFEKPVNRSAVIEKALFLDLVRGFGLMQMGLTLGDKVCDEMRLFFAINRIGDAGAAAFEIGEAGDEVAIVGREVALEACSRVGRV
jgi:hypothetical protein